MYVLKKIISFSIVLIMAVTLICSCSFLPEELKFCKVNFYVDGKLYDSKTVVVGQIVSEPKMPAKENQIFVGWATEGAIAYKYDFSTKVLTNLNLHATFTIDAVSLTNLLTQQTMKSIVTVNYKSYNSAMGGMIETSATLSQGSGVVVDISGGYCYVLTNYHVIDNDKNYTNHIISVEDPWGNVYEAQIYKNPSKSTYAESEEYDLALICFEYAPDQKSDLQEITMADDPDVDEYIVSLGTPAGLQNTISYGTVIAYQKINAEEGSSLSKIPFDIILHNAQIDHGSSGGALVNTYGQLVGINFAGYGSGPYGCSIPVSKVIEFMNLFVY